MLRSLQHKRFKIRGGMLSPLPGCDWYARLAGIIVSKGNENDGWYKRPWYIQM